MKLRIQFVATSVFALALISAAGCSAPLTTREQGGLIGAGLGAGSGAIIGSTVGHAAVGALIGGPMGLLAGGLIGDQLMGQQTHSSEQERQIRRSQSELARQRREIERLKQDRGEY